MYNPALKNVFIILIYYKNKYISSIVIIVNFTKTIHDTNNIFHKL